ncbi:MAG: hydroxymethylglutaryl-CoA reductase, degradative [Anaerolineae bacterium]|nr:hydroxymethylglutaryl-CoA reductase, degradative [Anaerolineae bacterium]
MNKSSRLPGFYQLSVDERLQRVSEAVGLSDDDEYALRQGGLSLVLADSLVENVVGLHSLPLAVAPNFTINGRDIFVPMVVEEPSVVAAASHAARLIREGSGFTASHDEPLMIGQVQLLDVPDLDRAAAQVQAHTAELLQLANDQLPSIVGRGGGARGVETRRLTSRVGPMLVVHIMLDVRDAMGANAVNTVAEALAPRLAALTGGRPGLRILSNLADRRLARAECRIPHAAFAAPGIEGRTVVRGIVEAQAFAEADPYRAVTHNKGVMNGVDAVVVATGNDWRAVEAAAHAWAARSGQYGPLTQWDQDANGDLLGRLELPLALGIVGGTTRAHPVARLALRILGVETAGELAQVAVCVGLAQNLGALRALATEGIQQGHMTLHARQVAVAAGATGDLVQRIAEQLVAEGNVKVARAEELLKRVIL